MHGIENQKVYIVELIKMSENTLIKRLSNNTIWYIDLLAPASRKGGGI